jgi:Tfp pilus assembly protein PilF
MPHKPSAAESLFLKGNRHMAAGDAARAEANFREAIRRGPGLAEAHANLGLLLDRSGNPVEAEKHYRQSIACAPACGETHLNLGALLTGAKRFDEADSAVRCALALMPESVAAWSNLGVLQACRKQEAEAERSYRLALTLDPDYPLASFNLAYLLLRQGRFEEGWRRLEARNWYAALDTHLDCPRWRGESLQGKSVLIGFEAGHGDMIQFGRYAAELKARGAARVTVLCHPPLATLFATLDGADSALAFDQAYPASTWDYWTPPLSIPFHCGTRLDSIPARLPYLRAAPEKSETWAQRLATHCSPDDLRVGLVWKGNPRFENDADRSLPSLAALATLGRIPGVRYFSLQKGAGEDEAAAPPAGLPLVDLGPYIRDFSDTAAIVTNLDLVISVDTAAAHLAGALGKRCWVLLPDYKTDWRWLAGREDSPWYPGVMRLFRQPGMGDWSAVLTAVCAALRDLQRKPGAT